MNSWFDTFSGIFKRFEHAIRVFWSGLTRFEASDRLKMYQNASSVNSRSVSMSEMSFFCAYEFKEPYILGQMNERNLTELFKTIRMHRAPTLTKHA